MKLVTKSTGLLSSMEAKYSPNLRLLFSKNTAERLTSICPKECSKQVETAKKVKKLKVKNLLLFKSKLYVCSTSTILTNFSLLF
jgi:hypothetical protein